MLYLLKLRNYNSKGNFCKSDEPWFACGQISRNQGVQACGGVSPPVGPHAQGHCEGIFLKY